MQPRSSRRAGRWAAVAALIVTCVPPAGADEVSDFYRGRTLTLIVSNPAGGGYDLLARALAPFLAKHVAGNPNVVVQNMPGAAGILATNNLFNIAAKDGTVLSSISNTVPFEPLLGTAEARFDPLQFNWLGSPTIETGLLGVWHMVPVNSIEDARVREVTIAANGPHSTPSFYARLLNETLGTKLRLVQGYPGQSEFNLAMEKGEVDGTSSLFYSSLVATRPAWLRDKKIRLLVQYGFEKHPALPDVPFAPDLARNADDLGLMQAAFAALGVGRPYVMPPGVPAARVRAVQDALRRTFSDHDFLGKAQSLQLETSTAKSGDQLRDIVARAYGVSPGVQARLKTLYR
jgi:tripartite-type tricarboxylate transporter receptor subunit TctC